LAIALAVSVAGAQTWVGTLPYSPTNDAWTTPANWNSAPLWNGTDNPTFGNGTDSNPANICVNASEAVKSMTFTTSDWIGSTDSETVTVGSGGLTVNTFLTWGNDGSGKGSGVLTLAVASGANPTFNFTANASGNGIRLCGPFTGNSNSTVTITGGYRGAGDDYNGFAIVPVSGPETVNCNFLLTGASLGGQLQIGGGVTVAGNIEVSNPSVIQLGDLWTSNANAVISGNLTIDTGKQLYLQNAAQGDGTSSTGNGLITGQLIGGGQILMNRGANGDPYTIAFNPATGTNSGFSGSMQISAGEAIFGGTWTGMGAISLGYAGYMDAGKISGNASLGMKYSYGQGLSAVGGTGSGWTAMALVNPIGTLSVGTEGNSDKVTFGNLSLLAETVNGRTNDKLVVNGPISLGTTAGTTNALYISLTTPLNMFTNYTLATFDSLATGQQAFNTVYVGNLPIGTDNSGAATQFNGTYNGALPAGMATVANATTAGAFTSGAVTLTGGALYGGHHLVYTPGTGAAGSGSLVLERELIPGDINGDSLVDVADYDIWAANVGATNATWDMGDLNGDGLVDVADYDIWAANVGATAATPEPISMIILAIGGGLVALKRRPLGASLRVRNV
jgi:hypothetical protein